MITIVGLGRKKGDLTQNGLRAIRTADKLLVRTLKSQAGGQIKKYNPISMDDLYESASDFDALNQAIAQRVLAADSVDTRVVYCVDGDGLGDTSCEALVAQNPDVTVIAGVSDAAAILPYSSIMSVSAQDFPLWIDTRLPLVVRGLFNPFVAGEAKLWLMRFYGEQTPLFFCQKDTATVLPLCALDRQKRYEHNAYAFLPAQKDFEKERYGYQDLMRVMTRLCAPDGCPWDREQTHASIAKNMMEEANELCEAIRLNDLDNLEEECGDVMLQSVFHGFIAEKYGEFTTEDIVDRLCKKLIQRHTHVFGSDKAVSSEDALAFWQAAKRAEKK